MNKLGEEKGCLEMVMTPAFSLLWGLLPGQNGSGDLSTVGA